MIKFHYFLIKSPIYNHSFKNWNFNYAKNKHISIICNKISNMHNKLFIKSFNNPKEKIKNILASSNKFIKYVLRKKIIGLLKNSYSSKATLNLQKLFTLLKIIFNKTSKI